MKESPFAPGWRAVRQNIQPFLLIQSVTVVLVALYYLSPGFRVGIDHLQEVKTRGGLVFAAISTGVAGSILPEVARFLARRPLTPLPRLGFQFAFFAVVGITVDLLYRGLAVLFGSSASIMVVAEKVSVDQLVYSPCFSVPLSTLAFLWQSNKFSPAGTRLALSGGGFRARYASLLVTCWCFWIPVLGCVYALPSNLQFMLFLCADGAWSLLLVFISSEQAEIPTKSKPI